SLGDLEAALRDCLSRQAARSAAMADVADVAIRRAGRVRRRRTGATALALVLVTALAAGGVVRMGSGAGTSPDGLDFVGLGPEVPPSPQPSDPVDPDANEVLAFASSVAQVPMAKGSPPPVDVVVDLELRTSSGDTIGLSAVGAVAEAYRVAEGWLVVGAQAGGVSLWHV